MKKNALVPNWINEEESSYASAKSGSPKVNKVAPLVAKQMSPVPSNESSEKKSNGLFSLSSKFFCATTPKGNNDTPKEIRIY